MLAAFRDDLEEDILKRISSVSVRSTPVRRKDLAASEVPIVEDVLQSQLHRLHT